MTFSQISQKQKGEFLSPATIYFAKLIFVVRWFILHYNMTVSV